MPTVETMAAEDDVGLLMSMAPDFASVCSTAQTDASTFCYDMRAEPMKFADSATIQKSLRRAGSHDPTKAAKGCEETAWLALEATNRAAIGAEGGVETLLKALQRWVGKRSAILQMCLTALARLLAEPANFEAFYDFDSPLLQEMAKQRGYRGGGTLLVAAAMSGYPKKTDLQRMGCAVAAQLANDPLGSRRFIENGMIGHVLAAMHRHPDCAALCLEGLACFLTVARASAEARRWVAVEGVVLDYVAEALRLHAENSDVATAAAELLLALQEEPAALPEVRKTTCIPSVLECCETHAANTEAARLLLLAALPHAGEFLSRLDEYARCVKKFMSHCYAAEPLALGCVVAARLGAVSPSDAAKVRLARHLVPFIATAVDHFGEDPLVAAAGHKALASLVVNKWSTDLARPRRPRPVPKRPPAEQPQAPPAAVAATAAEGAAASAAAPVEPEPSPPLHIDPAAELE